MIPRTIFIRLDHFVDDHKRRERRRGVIAGAIIALALGVAVGSSRPARVETRAARYAAASEANLARVG